MNLPLKHNSPDLARIVTSFLIVALAMIEMFSVPKGYFVLGSLVATSCMICATFLVIPDCGSSEFRKTSPKTIVLGAVTAIVLYLVFVAGNAFVRSFSPLGVSISNENSIYLLFASTPILLRIVVFVLDAVGFESYFRGTLQRQFSTRIGVGSAFVVALLDSAIHISSLNPLFVATTFVADSIWGLNYYFTKDITSNITSHLLWDILIFIVFPIS